MKEKKNFFLLNPEHTHPARLKQERTKARQFKKSHLWQKKIQSGECFHCHKKGVPSELTLDHLVPLARGGKSTPGNMVPSCSACNQAKQLRTPADQLFEQLEQEKKKKEDENEPD